MLRAPSGKRPIPVRLSISDPSPLRRRYSVTLRQQTHIQLNPNELLDFFNHLLKQCTTIHHTKLIHAQIMLHGSSGSAFLATGVISGYVKVGCLNDARKVFETMPLECFSNLLLWNSVLRAHITNGEFQETLRLYTRMRNFGVWPDGFTFPLVLRACAAKGDDESCRTVHSHVVQLGFQDHIHVVNELVGMYGKLGQMNVACQVFERMGVKTHISWNTMISGFSLNYNCDGALEMFRRMKVEGPEPNHVTWTSLLSSHARCGHYGKVLDLYGEMRCEDVGCTAEALAVVISVCSDSNAFCTGEMMHGYTIRAGFGDYSFVKNSLICMYGKNGAVRDAEYLFSEIKSKNIVTWNALISCYADSGLCDEALATFSQMEKLDAYPLVKPNVISWSAVIGGFASKGRGRESLELFQQMQLADVTANSVTVSCILSACVELSALNLGREIHAHAIRGLIDGNILVGNGLINMYTKCGSLKYGNSAFEKMNDRDVYSWNTMITGYGMHGHGKKALRVYNQMTEAGYKADEVTFVAILSSCSHAGLVSEGRKIFYQMKNEHKIEPQMEHYSCMVDLLGRAGLLQEACDIVKSMPMDPNACVLGALLNSCRMYKNTDVAQETASLIFSLGSAITGSYMLLSNIYAASGKWEDSAKVRVSARTKGLKKIPGQSWIEVKKKVQMFASGNTGQMGMDEVYRVLNNLSLQMEMEGYELA